MTQPDTDKFRLRRFVEKLVQEGECIVHDDPIDLIDVAAVLDGNPGGGVVPRGRTGADRAGRQRDGRRGVASPPRSAPMRRAFRRCCASGCARPLAPIEVASSQAPVHEVVLTGDDADLTALPVHLQHGLDGAPYISASIDYRARPARTASPISAAAV